MIIDFIVMNAIFRIKVYNTSNKIIIIILSPITSDSPPPSHSPPVSNPPCYTPRLLFLNLSLNSLQARLERRCALAQRPNVPCVCGLISMDLAMVQSPPAFGARFLMGKGW